MSEPNKEQVVFDRFSKKYRLAQSELMRGIERSVCGCDYGATSWTTFDEAQVVRGMLALGRQTRVLDIGSGSGWPGVYIAKETGCDVALTDLPLTGLRIARKRAASDKVSGTVTACVASATELPFQSGWFDAILHSDVLCCLRDKPAALASCRRVVRDQGRMVFSVIRVAPGLSQAAYERGANGGPPFVVADTPYPEMLDQAGWDIVEHHDLTDTFRTTVGNMLDHLERYAREIGEIFGDDDAAAERERRRASLAALNDGLLRRDLYGVVPK